MDRLRQMLRRRVVKVAPQPVGSGSCLPQEESGPSVPAGGEAGSGWSKGWKRLVVWRRKAPAPRAGPEAPSGPTWRWIRVPLCGRDPLQGGSRAKQRWGFLSRKKRSQEPSPRAQEEPSPCLAPGEPPVCPEQELGDPGSSSGSSSTYSRGNSSSSSTSEEWESTESDGSPMAGTPNDEVEEDEDEDMPQEQISTSVIQEHLQGRVEWLRDRAKQLRFLQTIPALCSFAQRQGQDSLEPRYSKEAFVQSIVDILSELPEECEPSAIISNSMAAVSHLSELKPPLALELESRLLLIVLHNVFSMGTGKETAHFQAMHKMYDNGLENMLRSLLLETPTKDKLQRLLMHIQVWIHSRVMQERARAMRSSTALLRYAACLPGFESSSDFPNAEYLVAQLALYITDPAYDIGQQSKEGIYRVYQLLLQNRGLNNIRDAEQFWCHDGLQDTERLGYRNMARVGEVFGEIWTASQRKSFLEVAVLAIYDSELRVSLAGLTLAFSIVGEANHLIGDEQEDVTEHVMAQLYSIRCLGQVPKALQAVFPRGDP